MAPRRSWAKADNPFWSNHVAAWYRSALEAEHYCQKYDLSVARQSGWEHSDNQDGHFGGRGEMMIVAARR
jgi:hypothetical protein